MQYCGMNYALPILAVKENYLSSNKTHLQLHVVRTSNNETKFNSISKDYLQPALLYKELAVFIDSGLVLDQFGLMPINKATLKRLPFLLGSPRWKNQVLSFTTQVDNNPARTCSLGLINELISICLTFNQPIIIHTNYLNPKINMELMNKLNAIHCIHIVWKIASFNKEVHNKIEPYTTSYIDRLNNLRFWHEQGIECGIVVSPIIKGLNDHHIYEILRLASMAGAQWVACDSMNSQLKMLFNQHVDYFSYNKSTPAVFLATKLYPPKTGFLLF